MQARPFPFPFPFQPTPHLTCQHSQNRYHGVPPAQLVHFEIFQKIAISAYLIKEWPPTTVTKSLIRYHIRVGCNSSPWAPWQTASRLSDNAPPPRKEKGKKSKSPVDTTSWQTGVAVVWFWSWHVVLPHTRRGAARAATNARDILWYETQNKWSFQFFTAGTNLMIITREKRNFSASL